MKNQFRLTSLIVYIALQYCGDLDAAIIYSQTTPTVPTASFASSHSSTTTQRIADNFAFTGAEPRSVRSIRFIGGRGLVGPPQDDFRIVFLEDDAGSPGNPVLSGDYDIGASVVQMLTGGPLLNGLTPPREYIVNLPSELLLQPNRVYWISISNARLPATGWSWARANGNLDSRLASTLFDAADGPWTTVDNTGGMWFELSDQLIPEPSCLTILVLVTSMISLSRVARVDREPIRI